MKLANGQNRFYILIAIWLLLFLICSILSGIAYSVEESIPADNLPESTKEPPADTTTLPVTDEPPDIPEPQTKPDLYDSLPYAASNAEHVIFLDAGHGWSDNGASVPGENEGELIFEKDLTFELVSDLKKALETMGYTVKLTRPGDQESDCPMSLIDGIFRSSRRVEYVNSIGADYLISIHADSFTNPDTRGTRVYYSGRRDSNLKLASAISTNLASAMGEDPILRTDESLNVLILSAMPSVLIEAGFITNETDLANIQNTDWQDKFACSVALGINEMFHPEAAE